MTATIRRLDDVQRRHPVASFPIAVVKKFGDDRAGQSAAVIAYYGFFSLFPLLLVFVTVLGMLLNGNPELRARILTSALAQFPIIGDQIRENIGSLPGSGIALVAGAAATLWAGLGVVRAFQNAMNDVWNVERARRPNLIRSILRSLATIVAVGVVLAVGSVVPQTAGAAWWLRVGSIAVGLALNFGLFVFSFRMLTVADVSWRDVIPGAAVAAVAWVILHAVGGWYLGSRLKGAGEIYGFFAIVIGLLTWLALAAHVVLLAAEVNVVRVRRLWPRSLTDSAAQRG